jgi:hypothetical protein
MLTEFLTQKSAGPYNPMLAYGYFIFNLYTVPYQSLQQEQVWRHAANQRVGARPAYQFLGAGEQTITLTGTLVPELTGGRVTLTRVDDRDRGLLGVLNVSDLDFGATLGGLL